MMDIKEILEKEIVRNFDFYRIKIKYDRGGINPGKLENSFMDINIDYHISSPSTLSTYFNYKEPIAKEFQRLFFEFDKHPSYNKLTTSVRRNETIEDLLK